MIPEGLILAVSGSADGSMATPMQNNRAEFLRSLGLAPDRLATGEQVHGSSVREVWEPGVFAATDGLLTREPGLSVLILGADCPLVCLYDPGGQAWRNPLKSCCACHQT